MNIKRIKRIETFVCAVHAVLYISLGWEGKREGQGKHWVRVPIACESEQRELSGVCFQ